MQFYHSLLGDSFLSLAFQSELIGNHLAQKAEVARDIGYGSVVTLRNARIAQCWLHSHPHRYPIYPSGNEKGLVSSHQQQVGAWWWRLEQLNIHCLPIVLQVTCYQHFNDPNNWWRIEDANVKFDFSKGGKSWAKKNAANNFRPIPHNSVIRLVHVETGLPLNSHDVAASLTPQSQEVSCYASGDERVPADQPGHMPLNDQFLLKVGLVGDE